MASRRSSGTESKPLIVSLVFVILALLGVSIYLYIVMSNQDQVQKDFTEKVNHDAQEYKAEAEYYKFLALQLKSYTQELKDSEKDNLDKLRKKFKESTLGKGDPERNDYLDLFAKYDPVANPKAEDQRTDAFKDFLPKDIENLNRNWGGELAKVNGTFKSEIIALRNKLVNQQKEIKSLSDEKNALGDQLANEKKEHDNDRTEFAKKLDEQAKKAAATLGAAVQRVDAIDKESKDAQQKADQVVGQKTAADKARKEAEDAKALAEKERDRVINVRAEKEDLLKFEKPRGEIYAVERVAHTAMVRLASTRNLEVGQTMSIHGANQQGKDLEQSKGSLKVIEVLDDHFCRASLDAKEPNRDPIMKGDKVYSLGWDPNRKTHVVLVGLMDSSAMSGEGGFASTFSPAEAVRGMADFKRGLERQGIVVDAYMDMNTFKLEGKIQPETDYLIVGGHSEMAKIKTDTGEELAMTKAISALESDAIKRGVTVIPLRRFMAISGMPVLRSAPER
jgi:hypothetical protein